MKYVVLYNKPKQISVGAKEALKSLFFLIESLFKTYILLPFVLGHASVELFVRYVLGQQMRLTTLHPTGNTQSAFICFISP